MILFIDVDGTLLDSGHNLRQRTIDALYAAHLRGHRTVISTGRCVDGIRPILEALPFKPYLSTLNGAYIVSPKDKVLYESPFDTCDALAIARLIARHSLGSLYFAGPVWGSGGVEDYEREEAIVREPGLRLGLEEVIRKRHVHKILAVCPAGLEKASAFIDEMAQELPFCDPLPSSPIYIEVNTPGTSKGLGVVKLLESLGKNRSQAIAFGDWDNDISMFLASGHSVCMANGSDKAKAKADEITASNDEDGLAKWIEEHLIRGKSTT